MPESIIETTVLSRKERQRIAEIERTLSSDQVLVAVAGLFAQPPAADTTLYKTTPLHKTTPRPLSGQRSRVCYTAAVLLGVLAVMTAAACAVAAHLLAPPVAALLIVTASGAAAVMTARSLRHARHVTRLDACVDGGSRALG